MNRKQGSPDFTTIPLDGTSNDVNKILLGKHSNLFRRQAGTFLRQASGSFTAYPANLALFCLSTSKQDCFGGVCVSQDRKEFKSFCLCKQFHLATMILFARSLLQSSFTLIVLLFQFLLYFSSSPIPRLCVEKVGFFTFLWWRVHCCSSRSLPHTVPPPSTTATGTSPFTRRHKLRYEH